MAATEGAKGPRFVGSVVDPAVLDGGESEPEVHLAATETTVVGSAPEDPSGSADPSASALPSAQDPSPAPQDDPSSSPRPSARAGRGETPGWGEAASGTPVADLPAERDPTLLVARGAEMRARLLERARGAASSEPSSPPSAPELAGLDEMDPVGASPRSAREWELARLAEPGSVLARPVASVAALGALSPNVTAALGTLAGLATIASIVALATHFDRRVVRELASSPASASAFVVSAPVASAASTPRPQRRVRKPLPGPWRVADDRDRPGMRLLKGKIGSKAFLTAVQDAGLKKAEAYRLVKAYEGVRDLDKCARTDTFVALVERASGRLRGFEYVVSPEEVYQAKENSEGLLRGERLDLKVAYESYSGAFAVTGSLDESAAAAGFEPGLRDTLARALAGHLDLDEVVEGARLRVIAQEVTVLGVFARYAGIEALEIVPDDPKRQRQRYYYFKGASERGYYDAKGRSPYEGGWRRPVPGAPVTSQFNPQRMHPILKKRMPHNGTDFGAPAGTPVHASSFGTVSFVGWGGPAGNLVKIQHPGEIETLYFHLSRFEPGLKVGDHVDRMQVIGYVGSTGRSTGPHLHFGVKRAGKYIDPMTLNLDALRVIAGDERAAFEAVVKRYDAMLDAIPLPAAPPRPMAQAAAPAPTLGEGEEGEGSEETAVGSGDTMDVTVDVAAPPTASPPAAAPPAPGPGRAAVFLTDKELLELQGAASDGEVPE